MVILWVVIISILSTLTLYAGTLDDIQTRGFLKCGISTGLTGFAEQDETGQWKGFDVDFCRSTAAAIFDDPSRVEFVPLSTKNRFTALHTGDIDLLYRNTTWTASRDLGLDLTFPAINFYDGQGFLAPKSANISNIKQLDGSRICVISDTTHADQLNDYLTYQGITYTPVVLDTTNQVRKAYEAGNCNIITSDRSQLAAQRSQLQQPNDHTVLDTVISTEPLGPVIKAGDERFSKLVRYVLFGLIEAERLGINADNVDKQASNQNPNIRRLLGLSPMPYNHIGLPQNFIARSIKHTGNYGEIYDRHIGVDSNIGLERGLNALWNHGGILHAPPMR